MGRIRHRPIEVESDTWTEWTLLQSKNLQLERRGTDARIEVSIGNIDPNNLYEVEIEAEDGAGNLSTANTYVQLPRSGDVTKVILHGPDAEPDFDLIGPDSTIELIGDDESITPLTVSVNPQRGDWELKSPDGSYAGTIIFSDRFNGESFATSGKFLLAPATGNDLPGDNDPGANGYQGTYRFTYQTRDGFFGTIERVHELTFAPGMTTSGAGAVVGGSTVAPIAAAQHRLRALGFPGETGPLAIDGIIGPETRNAIGLFNAAAADPGSIGAFTPADRLSADSLLLINSDDAPSWQSLPGVPDEYAVSWLVDTVAGAGLTAEFGANQFGDINDPIFGAGLAVSIALPAGTGGDTPAEALKNVYEASLLPGGPDRRVKVSTGDPSIAAQANQLAGVDFASVQPGLTGAIVALSGPAAASPPVNRGHIEQLGDEAARWFGGIGIDRNIPQLIGDDGDLITIAELTNLDGAIASLFEELMNRLPAGDANTDDFNLVDWTTSLGFLNVMANVVGRHDSDSGEILLDLSLEIDGQTQELFDFGAEGEAYGLTADAIASVAVDVDLFFTVGYGYGDDPLAPPPVESEGFISVATATAAIDVDVNDLDAAAQLGFAAAAIDDGWVALDVDMVAGLDSDSNGQIDSPDTRISVAEMISAAEDAFASELTTQLSGELPIRVELSGVEVASDTLDLSLDPVDGFLISPDDPATPNVVETFDTILDELLEAEHLNPEAIWESLQRLVGWLDGAGGADGFADALPMAPGSVGDLLRFGSGFLGGDDGVLQELIGVRLPAAAAPTPFDNGNDTVIGVPADMRFDLVIGVESTVPVTLTEAATAENTTVVDLANDLAAAIDTATAGTAYEGLITVVSEIIAGATESQRLVLVATAAAGSIAIALPADATANDRRGLARIGFAEGAESDGLSFASIQEMIARLVSAAGFDGDPNLRYVPGVGSGDAGELVFTLSAQGDANLPSLPFRASSIGPISGLNASGSLSAEADANGSVTVRLGLGSLASLSNPIGLNTALDNLNAGNGVAIESTGPHLAITLPDGDVFLVDLSGVVDVSDVLAAIEDASKAGPDAVSGRIHAELVDADGTGPLDDQGNPNDDVDRIRLTLTDQAGDGEGVLSVAGAVREVSNAIGTRMARSTAALNLGLAGSDDDGDGVFTGLPLHGRSIGDRFTLDAGTFAASAIVTGTDLSADGQIGFVSASIFGTASASIGGSFEIDSPITLAELLAGGASAGIANSSVAATAEAEFTVTVEGIPGGLSLPQNAGFEVNWQDALDFDSFEVTPTGLDDLMDLGKLTFAGLVRDTPLAELNNGLGFDAGRIEVTLRDNRVITVDLGSAITVGDVIDAFRVAEDDGGNSLGGRLRVSIGNDGRHLMIGDGGSGGGPLIVADENGTTTAVDLGLVGSEASGIIEGATVFAPSILSALREAAAWLRQVESMPAIAESIPFLDVAPGDLVGLADRIDEAIDAIADGPTANLQKLAEVLEAELGSGLTVEVIPGVGDAGPSVVIAFVEQTEIGDNVSRPISLASLADEFGNRLGGIVGLSGDGQISVEASAEVRFAVGVDLSVPADPRAFLDVAGTGVDVGVRAYADNLSFTASVGPLRAGIVGGTARLSSVSDDNAPATIAIGLNDNDGIADGRVYLDSLSTDFETLISTNVDGEVDVSLPVNVAGTACGSVTVAVPNLSQIGQAGSIDVSQPDWDACIASIGTNLEGFLDGWAGLMQLLDRLADGTLLPLDLPVIGPGLTEASEFLDRLRDDVLDGNYGDLTGSDSVNNLRQGLMNALGSWGQVVQVIEENGDDGLLSAVIFDLELGGTIQNVGADLAFDLGLPGLGLSLDNGRLGIDTTFTLNLAVGLDLERGLFVTRLVEDTNADELTIDIDAGLLSGNLNGTLGFLNVNVTEVPGEQLAGVDFGLTADLLDGTKRYYLSEMGVDDFDLDVDINTGSVEVNAQITGELPGMPRVRTDLLVDWNFNNSGSRPTVDFSNVSIEVGSVLGDFLAPIAGRINAVLGPTTVLLEQLRQPLPIISEFGTDYSLLDLAERYGRSQGLNVEYLKYFDAAADIVQLTSSLFDYANSNSGETWVNVGDFDLDGFAARSANSAGNISATGHSGSSAFSQLSGNERSLANAAKEVGMDGGASGGFVIPILEDPYSAVNYLLGQDVTLFGYDMPKLDVGLKMDVPLGAFAGIAVKVGGRLGAEADFAFGYDTAGLRAFDPDLGNYEALLDGFFVSDTANVTGTGEDVPEVSLFGELFVGADVNALVLKASLEGGIGARILFRPPRSQR